VPLSDEQRREAVGLLAELLIDAALKREGVVSGGGAVSPAPSLSYAVRNLCPAQVASRRVV
jgi:hypothetical protein